MEAVLPREVASQPDNPPLTPGAIQIIIMCSVFTPLAICFVALRFWARRIKGQSLAFNDWAMIVASVFNCGQSALLIYASVAGGIGHHITELATDWPAAIPKLSKAYVAAEPLWIVTNSMIKFSILHFYTRVFCIKSFRRLCYAVMGLTAGYWISTLVRMFFLCQPFAATWDPSLLATIPGAHCVDLPAAYLSVSVTNLILDVIVFCLPLPMVWRLHLQNAKKLALTAIFAIGLFICIITALRIRSVVQLSLVDTSYTVTEDAIWSTLEPCLGIINACLPILQPVGAKFSNLFIWSSLRGSYGKDESVQGAVHGSSPHKIPRDANRAQRHQFISIDETPFANRATAYSSVTSGLGANDFQDIPVEATTSSERSLPANGEIDNNVTVTVDWELRHETI